MTVWKTTIGSAERADALRAAMVECGLSYRSLAKNLDVSPATISNWVNCKTEPDTADVIMLAFEFIRHKPQFDLSKFMTRAEAERVQAVLANYGKAMGWVQDDSASR